MAHLTSYLISSYTTFVPQKYVHSAQFVFVAAAAQGGYWIYDIGNDQKRILGHPHDLQREHE
jgi:hypothetical protein